AKNRYLPASGRIISRTTNKSRTFRQDIQISDSGCVNSVEVHLKTFHLIPSELLDENNKSRTVLIVVISCI
ncbi:MAG: hypothetical protein PHV82_09435, partial [Victivallaceae bacterium]|nr:hypothetical protein [Victivallaceae bacterium]